MDKFTSKNSGKIWQLQGSTWVVLALDEDHFFMSGHHLKTLPALKDAARKSWSLKPKRTTSYSTAKGNTLKFPLSGNTLRIKFSTSIWPWSWKSFTFKTEEEMQVAGHLIGRQLGMVGRQREAPIKQYIAVYFGIIILTVLLFYMLDTVFNFNWIPRIRPGGRWRTAASMCLLFLSKAYKIPFFNFAMCLLIIGGLVFDFIRRVRRPDTEWYYTRA